MIANDNGEQKLILIQGQAGTGKSFLIRCIQMLLKNKVKTGAFTAKAASNVDGETLHRLFMLRNEKDEDQGLNLTKLDELKKAQEGVTTYIIDEFSMLGCRTLN